MNNLREKLSKHASDKPSEWKAKAQCRRKNREWLKKSRLIAVSILDALKKQNLSKEELAERMRLSDQEIKKVVKGQENLGSQTISKLEMALGIRLLK